MKGRAPRNYHVNNHRARQPNLWRRCVKSGQRPCSLRREDHPYNDPDYLLPLLVREGLLSREQVAALRPKLAVPRRMGIDLVEWLSSLKLTIPHSQRPLDGPAVVEAVARDQGWRFRRLDPLKLDMEVVTRTIPASFARRRLVLPIEQRGGVLEVACYDPLDRELLQDLRRVCQGEIEISVAPREDIQRIIREFFDFRRSIAKAEGMLHRTPDLDIANLEQYVQLQGAEAAASDKYIQRAVDHLFQYALEQRASDIHIEPKREESLIRFRIDGVLHVVYRIPRVVHEALCTRIKALSKLNIAEKRRPQDGRMKVAWQGEDAEVRVSTVPVAFGEKMVLRLQSAAILFSDLDGLGLSPSDLETYRGFLGHTHGMVLITGPTGSGKSTTLYSTLRHLATPEVNIVTIEDPIEMVHEGFNQIAVQPQIGVTFSTILRNILRQDPDIIMVGEIRDGETARYALQAALTGHLVFSTLHTNDSVGAVTRLKDLGLEPYLIASTLLGVVAQRLVRKVCRNCARKEVAPAAPLRALGVPVEGERMEVTVGRGCAQCRQTGYYGRIGVYEVFPVTEEVKELIHGGATEEELRRAGAEAGMRPLAVDACQKLMAGITTLEEVMRVAAS